MPGSNDPSVAPVPVASVRLDDVPVGVKETDEFSVVVHHED